MTPVYHDWLPSERRFLGDWPLCTYIAIADGQDRAEKPRSDYNTGITRENGRAESHVRGTCNATGVTVSRC